MKLKKQIPIFVVIAVIIALIVGTVIHMNLNSADNTGGIGYTQDQPHSWNEKIPDKSNAEGIKIPGFGRVYFPSNLCKVQMTLANPIENEYSFIYAINLNEPDGELLYTSCEIAPGMALSEITLSKPLDAGEYTLYIHIEPHDIQSGKSMNNALLKVPLTVTDK